MSSRIPFEAPVPELIRGCRRHSAESYGMVLRRKVRGGAAVRAGAGRSSPIEHSTNNR